VAHCETQIIAHIVWATSGRQPLLTPSVAEAVELCVHSEARKLGCQVLAVGGTVDHVHVLVKLPPTLSLAKLVNQMKGVSSALARRVLGKDCFFGWQSGYGAFTVCPPCAARVARYVNQQAAHHQEERIWPALEQS
jgi:REP element-mobilizing transposase RayT